MRGPSPPSSAQQILIAGERYRHIPDVRAVEIGPDQGFAGGIAEITGLRTFLMVPLRNDGIVRGFLTAHRLDVRPFSAQDIALLESFAAQAVIAMENARLLTEQREALEQQTATAEVLQVINASPGNLAPVFDAILEKAHQLCGVTIGALDLRRRTRPCTGDARSAPRIAEKIGRMAKSYRPQRRHSQRGRSSNGDRSLIVPYVGPVADPGISDFAGSSTFLAVALRKDTRWLAGYVAVREVRPFTDKEIALAQNFRAHRRLSPWRMPGC